MTADSVRFAALGLSPLMGRDDLRSVRARRRQTGRRLRPSACGALRRLCRSSSPQRTDSRPRPAAGCVGRALGRSVGSVAVQWRVTRLARANPCAAAPASRQRPGPPAVKLGTAAAASTVAADSSAQTRWQMRLTGRALASDWESTPNEAADVPAAVSRSLTATGSARPAADSPACPASRVPLQPRTTAPDGPRSEKPVSHQAPHARRSALMTR
jgi:hypothetical protein